MIELARSGAFLLDCARAAGVTSEELGRVVERAKRPGSDEAAWLDLARAARSEFRVRVSEHAGRGAQGAGLMLRQSAMRCPVLDDETAEQREAREPLKVVEGGVGKLTPSVRRRIHALAATGLSQRRIAAELAKEGVELTQTSVRNALLEPAPSEEPTPELTPDVDDLPLPELEPGATAQVVVLHSRLRQIRADIAARRPDFRRGDLSAMHWRALLDLEAKTAAQLADAMPPEKPDAHRDPHVRRAREVIVASLTANIEGAEARCGRFFLSGAALAELESIPAARAVLERYRIDDEAV